VIEVNVTATSIGDRINTTSTITSSAGTGAAATASLNVTLLSRAHDFNGDGKSDIVWQDASGNTAVWLMNGSSVLSDSSFPMPGWSLVGQHDFNADGKLTSGTTTAWRATHQ
jgi:hypothetical protein